MNFNGNSTEGQIEDEIDDIDFELQKIQNITSSTSDTTTFSGKINVAEIKADNNGDNSSLLMDDGEVVFKTDGYMEINSGWLLNVRGDQGISLITPSLQTSMTNIVNDNHIIHKKYLDDSLAPISGSIQHITADATGTTLQLKTNMTETVIGSNALTENIYISNTGDSIGLYKDPEQRGGIEYFNQTGVIKLGGSGFYKIYGNNNSDFAGQSVSISKDGNIIAVSHAGYDNTAQNETNNGACFVYKNVNGVYTQLGQVLYSADSSDYLNVVALSDNGYTVAFGSYQNDNNRGVVEIYRYDSSSEIWINLGSPIFGENVGDEHGITISLSSDGNTIIIGANKADPNGISSGHARIFRFNGSGWSQVGDSIEGNLDDNAGISVAINGASDRIIVGMPFIDINGTNNVGTGKIYDLVNEQWVFNTQIDGTVFNTRLGLTVKMSEDGNTVAISSEEANNQTGYAEVYTTVDGVNWSQLGQRIVGKNAGDLMTKKNSMSLSKDGLTLALGAYFNDDGGVEAGHIRVYRYNQTISLWVQIGSDLVGSVAGERFGWIVDLNDDGNILIAGSPFADDSISNNNKGAFYMYQFVIDRWIEMSRFGKLIYSNFTDLYTGVIDFEFDISMDWTTTGGIFSFSFAHYTMVYTHFSGSGSSFKFYSNESYTNITSASIPNNGIHDIVKLEVRFDTATKTFTVQSRGVVLLSFTDNVGDTPTSEQLATFTIQAGSNNGLPDGVRLYDIKVLNDTMLNKVEIDSNAINLNGIQPIIFKDTGTELHKAMIVSGDDDKLSIFGTRGVIVDSQAGDCEIKGNLKQGNWAMNYNTDDAITLTHKTAGVIDNITTIANPPPSPTKSTIISHIDYSNMYPSAMLASISSVDGGTNKCWGRTATYLAGVNLLAGRVVSLQDQSVGSDDTQFLKVGYLVDDAETFAGSQPIGITLHNANAGEKITVCILGYVTAIAYNSDSSPERGSLILAGPTSSDGKVYINTTGSSNEARIGFMAQSNAVSSNAPVLIYYSGWYQPY